jgi:Tfp pilus assembly protein PilF
MEEEIDALLKQCVSFQNTKKYKEILQLLPDEILNKYNNKTLYAWVGYAYGGLSEKEKAIDYYTKSIQIDNKYYLAYNNRGFWFKKSGEKQKAIDDYSKAIDINPMYAACIANRGIVYFEIEKYDLAIADFERSLTLDYDNNNFVESNLEEAKENILLQGVSKNKQEIKDLKNAIEKNVQAILKETREDKVKYVAHYTKLGVVKSLVEKPIEIKKDEAEKQVNGLWYFNVIYMNDPEEGEILFNHFFKDETIKECFENGKRANETSVYLGCFLSADENNSHEDDLVMWRTYGKDEKKTEAAGCSMVISSDFFDKKDDIAKYRKMELSMATTLFNEQIDMKQPQTLLKVIYLNKNDISKALLPGIKKELTKLKSNLNELIGYREAKNRKEEEKKLIDKIIFEKLSKICYLFKSSDYAFENEIRVIEYVPLGSRKIKKLIIPLSENAVGASEYPPARLYIESNKDILPYTNKIYLGAKVPHHSHWSTYLDYEIRQREKEREKRDVAEADKKEIKIEIIKSTCNFQ